MNIVELHLLISMYMIMVLYTEGAGAGGGGGGQTSIYPDGKLANLGKIQ